MPLFRSRRAATLVGALAIGAAVLPGTACAPRAIQVSGAQEPPAAGLSFTNGLRTAVNVYVRPASGTEMFVRQVPAGATEALVVRGVSPGALVSLRAAPVDGGATYNRDNVALGTGAAWSIP